MNPVNLHTNIRRGSEVDIPDASLRARLRYAFDKSMSRGTVALIGWLALISLVVVVFAGVLVTFGRITEEGESPPGIGESVWRSLMRTLDPGTMGGDSGWGYRAVMLAVTVAGIFIVSSLIGVLSSGLEDRLANLRKGRSLVLERDHTIVLNWSPTIFDVLSELASANESRSRPRIVVMADRDKVEMEEEIKAKVSAGKTEIICRTGDPTDLDDLYIANPHSARSIVILSPTGSDDPDPRVIKTILALVNDPNRRSEKHKIAAEIRKSDNVPLARAVGGSELQVIVADDLLARVFVHSTRQPGLSDVHTEMLKFEGSEIYTVQQPALTGKAFDFAVMAYERCIPIGLADSRGRVRLNPPGQTVISDNDRLVIIAADDSAIQSDPSKVSIDESALCELKPAQKYPDRTLLIGWNHRGPRIVTELSRYLEPGSVLTIAADAPGIEEIVDSLALADVEIQLRRTNIVDRRGLDSLDVPSYDHVMVLGSTDLLDAQTADTQTLVVLIQLRQIAEAAGRHISVVSEMIDVRNCRLAQTTRTDDFVISNKLTSLMLAQASENEAIGAIFDELLDEASSEFYLRPVADYIAIDRPVNFYTVAEAARRRGEIAVGYFTRNGDGTGARRVVLNPVKTVQIQFEAIESIVVLAED